jgi:hypothetical protein
MRPAGYRAYRVTDTGPRVPGRIGAAVGPVSTAR